MASDPAAPLTVTLSPEASEMVRALAVGGGFETPEAFVEAAASAWMATHGLSAEKLAKLVDEAEADGVDLDAHEVFEELAAKLRGP